MYIESSTELVEGKVGHPQQVRSGVVHWDNGGSIQDIECEVRERALTSLVFADSEFFDDQEFGIEMCHYMRVREVNTLWSAQLTMAPTEELFRAMRLAGCQHVDMRLEPDVAVESLRLARLYGLDIRLCNLDGTPYASDKISYTITERVDIAARLPGLHSAQFDLAVAFYTARRYSEVMLPLGKAMTLRFPKNELCLNLLACLSAAKHYPDQAAGLLDQAGYGCPHPVVFRNRKLLKSWLQSGGDIRGVRLELEPAGGSPVVA